MDTHRILLDLLDLSLESRVCFGMAPNDTCPKYMPESSYELRESVFIYIF